MNKILNEYKRLFPVIILFIYALGYTYLNRYYSNFNISIENYISLSDIIFFTIKYLFQISLIFFIIEVILILATNLCLKGFYEIKYFKSLNRIRKNKVCGTVEKFYKDNIDSKIDNDFTGVSILLFIIACILIAWLTEESLYVITIFFPFFFVKFYFIIKETNNNTDFVNSAGQFILATVMIILIICFGIWGYIDGRELTEVKNDQQKIEFSQNEKTFSTIKNKDLTYIGETSLYIFIYNLKEDNTLIFNKGSIKDLVVKNN